MTTLEQKINLALRWIVEEDPIDKEHIEDQIRDILEEAADDMQTTPYDETISLLLELGIMPNRKGFDMIIEAIELVRNDRNRYMGSITKQLYPTLAKKFNTTPHRVERNIRSAIEAAFDNGAAMNFTELFGGCRADKGKLENSAFISVCALEIERRMRG